MTSTFKSENPDHFHDIQNGVIEKRATYPDDCVFLTKHEPPSFTSEHV